MNMDFFFVFVFLGRSQVFLVEKCSLYIAWEKHACTMYSITVGANVNFRAKN